MQIVISASSDSRTTFMGSFIKRKIVRSFITRKAAVNAFILCPVQRAFSRNLTKSGTFLNRSVLLNTLQLAL